MPTITVEQALATATTFHHAGELPAAETICRQILAVQPRHPDTLHLLGSIALAKGNCEEGLELTLAAVTQVPSQANWHCDLGVAQCLLRHPEEGVASFRRALALDPDLAAAHINLGQALAALGRLDEAIASCQRGLALEPNDILAHNNLGRALWEKGQAEEAFACFHRALMLEPNSAGTHVNMALALAGSGKFDEAVFHFQRAVTLEPDFGEAHWNLGLVLLLLGRYKEGWTGYEWRLRDAHSPNSRRNLTKPRWDGGAATGKTILLHAEQGFGDALQFVRYVPLVRKRANASRVILECPPELTRLLVQTGGWNAEIVARKDWDAASLPPFDLHLPLLSLPFALRCFNPLPMEAPYLRADAELRAIWHNRLGPASTFRVGLIWAGSPLHSNDRRRSIYAEEFLSLLRLPGVTFYQLQTDVSCRPNAHLVDEGLIDLTNHIGDFADTAAFVAELDLIISVDTAVAHVAGALGRPVWTLLPFIPDWRWGLDPDETPWYPTMQLFRQPRKDDWDTVLRRVADKLATVAARRVLEKRHRTA